MTEALSSNLDQWAKWVNVTRLSYGVPEKALQDALAPFGKVLQVKMDVYKNVYIGVRNILMEIANPIPSSLKVADHWCNIFYPGQTPTCFSCRQVGHTRATCPNVVAAVPAVDGAVEAAPVLLSPARGDLVQQVLGSVVEQVNREAATFAEVVNAGH